MELRRLLLCIPLALSLAACDESRFVVDPLGGERACDNQLAAVWRIEDDNDGAPEYVVLDADCDAHLLRPAHGGEGGVPSEQGASERIDLAPSIGRIDGTLYATLTDDDFHRAAGEEERGHPDTPAGFHVFRLDASKDRVLLRSVDHVALAKAIIDGKAKGEVSKTDAGLKNLASAESDTLKALLGERWLFRREDPLVLRRVALENLPAALRARLEPKP